MRLIMERIFQGEEEVVIRYAEMTGQIQSIIGIVQGRGQKLRAVCGGETLLFDPEDIFYLESVDGGTFAYSKDRVGKVSEGLGELAVRYEDRGFFRCSKSMVLNIYKISYLKSEPGNRIRATMENEEQVLISRRYAKQLRQILKGEEKDEE